MTWTAPRTWAYNEIVTETQLNTHVRDNLIALRDETPAVALYASATQTITNATWTSIAFDSEHVDVGAMHDSSTNNTRVTVVAAGRYLLTGAAPFTAASNTVGLGIRLLISGGPTAVGELKVPGCSQASNGPSTSWMLDAAAATYFELQMWQNSGGSLDTIAGITGVTFTATRL